jgi:hypothetical protein
MKPHRTCDSIPLRIGAESEVPQGLLQQFAQGRLSAAFGAPPPEREARSQLVHQFRLWQLPCPHYTPEHRFVAITERGLLVEKLFSPSRVENHLQRLGTTPGSVQDNKWTTNRGPLALTYSLSIAVNGTYDIPSAVNNIGHVAGYGNTYSGSLDAAFRMARTYPKHVPESPSSGHTSLGRISG